MTTYTLSSPPRTAHQSPVYASPLSTTHQQEPVTLTARKVDLELLRLKGLGKVTRKSNTEDQKETLLPTEALQNSVAAENIDDDEGNQSFGLSEFESREATQQRQLTEHRHQLETSQQQLKNHQQQVHNIKEELNIQYQQQLEQQEQRLQQEMVKYQTQLVQQEKLAHDTIANYIEKVESSQVNVRKLTLLVEKQDQLIELLVERQEQQHLDDKHRHKQQPSENSMAADWNSLRLEKQQLETAIDSLKASTEINQGHMQMMMMVSTEIQNDFERQKAIMQQQLAEMVDELAAKDTLLRHYQEQQLTTCTSTTSNTLTLPSSPPPQQSASTKSSASYRPIVNENVVPTPDTSRYPSLVSSSSSSSSSASSHPSLSYSSSPSPPPLQLSNSSSVASIPSSPPFSVSLPPIAPQLASSHASLSTTTKSTSFSANSSQQQQYGPPPMATLDTIAFGGAVKKGTSIPSTPRTGSLDESNHHGKPFWKSMKTKWRNS
ncbi:hypothetical protein BCR42DRAFT_412956 [Absidia repens]|uniref:Uncharacterized protein n=1 Tax=Absidia repens TaxID=90262 RepID=A0A1X2IKG7_9FUNG|nr:hypothetical protein BCR42DRAFT_412956 [Absidia repens]